MALIKWEGSVSVGIDLVDEEHKKLIGFINDLQAAIERDANESDIVKLFEELRFYMIAHFDHEETLFADTDYPEAEQIAHVKEHERLRERLLIIHNQLEDGDLKILTKELMEFLVEWLIMHAQGVDMRFVPFVKAKSR